MSQGAAIRVEEVEQIALPAQFRQPHGQQGVAQIARFGARLGFQREGFYVGGVAARAKAGKVNSDGAGQVVYRIIFLYLDRVRAALPRIQIESPRGTRDHFKF